MLYNVVAPEILKQGAWKSEIGRFLLSKYLAETASDKRIMMIIYNRCDLTSAIAEHRCRLLGQLLCCKYACVMRLFNCVLCVYYVLNGGPVNNQHLCIMIAEVTLRCAEDANG